MSVGLSHRLSLLKCKSKGIGDSNLSLLVMSEIVFPAHIPVRSMTVLRILVRIPEIVRSGTCIDESSVKFLAPDSNALHQSFQPRRIYRFSILLCR